eukprot:TRINITY_DN2573_c0_g3_i1.p1 TRINITY_DN2573_c0_g3~~TRINITY_DN2573_c0_g3_i1.p1  ORF type:complete len:517 (+),score=45.54 TRINITY_DN2573_c0_g3_i1:480-2030(+)
MLDVCHQRLPVCKINWRRRRISWIRRGEHGYLLHTYTNDNVGERQQGNRMARCYTAVVALLDELGRVFAGSSDFDTQEDATNGVMREILTRSLRRGLPYDPLDWLPSKTKETLQKQATENIRCYVNDPNRVARAQEKAGVTVEAIHSILKEILPDGRGWRPTPAKVIAARKTRTDIMQRLLPVWATSGDGHFVSLVRQLQIILPFYCSQVEEMGFNWTRLSGNQRDNDMEEDDDHNPLIDDEGSAMAEFAVSFDGRSRGKNNNYLTCTIGSKFATFHKQWQSKEWVFSVCEVKGNDSASNLESNCTMFWEEVQKLVDGYKIPVRWRDKVIEFRITLTFPADMKAHWALTRQGGAGGTIHSGRPCHRCECTKGELDQVFEIRVLKSEDSLTSLATECGVFPRDLKMVNNLEGDEEKAHKALHDQQDSKLTNFYPRVQWPDGDDEPFGARKAGAMIRIFKIWRMERETPRAFIQVPHHMMPYCSLHGMMRLTEGLLRPLQVRIHQNFRWYLLNIQVRR